MSRVGNAPITLPDGVDLSANGAVLTAKGSKGELSMTVPSNVDVRIEDKVVTVKPGKKDTSGKAIWGTVRANINNMVAGVATGFTRNLEINGVGYRAAMQGNKLQLNLGFSHPVEMEIPAGLSVRVDNNTKIEITGADKQLLGQFASEIRAKRPPEPFKGKGVKYAEEHIVRKEGKKK
jgi:large subunit ribosomal protein L6